MFNVTGNVGTLSEMRTGTKPITKVYTVTGTLNCSINHPVIVVTRVCIDLLAVQSS